MDCIKCRTIIQEKHPGFALLQSRCCSLGLLGTLSKVILKRTKYWHFAVDNRQKWVNDAGWGVIMKQNTEITSVVPLSPLWSTSIADSYFEGELTVQVLYFKFILLFTIANLYVCRGCGFVQFPDERLQKRALEECQGAVGLGSKPLRLSLAANKWVLTHFGQLFIICVKNKTTKSGF